MSKAKKLPVRLSEMTPGQHADCFAQLAEKTHRSTRDGKPFYACRFRDQRRTVSVMVWADGGFFEECQRDWTVGGFFKLRGTFSEHEKFGPQLDLEQARPVLDRDREDGFTERDFVERSRFDPDALFVDLRETIAKELRDQPLLTLVRNLLDRHAAELKVIPASVRHYYPFPGGWLEHTLSVVRSCAFLADKYVAQFPDLKPPLNRDLVVAGAVLHDIGRVRELEVGGPGQPAKPGVSGELFGHLFLAYDMIREAARDVPDLNPELL